MAEEEVSRTRSRSVLIVYFALVLDNVLLTVVVPVLPVFLYQTQHSMLTAYSSEAQVYSSQDDFRPFLSQIRVRFSGEDPVYLPDNQTLLIASEELKESLRQKAKHRLAKSFSRISFKESSASVLPNVTSSAGPPNITREDIIKENARVGSLFASKAFVQLMTNPLIGYITSKRGYHLPFICGTVILLLSSIIFATVSSYIWLLLARSLQGVASSCISIAGMGLVAKLYDNEEERSKVMGYVLGGIAAGVLIGYPLGGVMFEFFGESAPFVVVSFAIGVLVAFQIHHVDENYYGKPDELQGDSGSSAPSYLKLLSNPYVLVATGSVWFSTTAMALLEPCLPIWLMDTIKPTKWQLGTVFLPDSFGYLIGTNCFALIALRFGRHYMAIIAMLSVGISAIMIPLCRSMLDLVMPHFFLGLGIGMVDSALMPLLAKLIDDSQSGKDSYGTIYAIVQTAVSLAYGLGPFVGGHLVTRIGFPELMRAVGILNIVYSPLLLILHKVAKCQQHQNVMFNNDDYVPICDD